MVESALRRLERVEVAGLFGHYDHDIRLSGSGSCDDSSRGERGREDDRVEDGRCVVGRGSFLFSLGALQRILVVFPGRERFGYSAL